MNTEQNYVRQLGRGEKTWFVSPAIWATLLIACWPPEVSVDSAPAAAMPGPVSAVGAEQPAPPVTTPVANPERNTEETPTVSRGPSSAANAAQRAVAAADAGPCGLENTACCAAPAVACAQSLACDGTPGVCVAAADAGVVAVPAVSCGAIGQSCCTGGTPSCAVGLGCSAAAGTCVTCSTFQRLGFFPGATNPYSSALGVSADGQVVVGQATDSSGLYRAFRWTAAGGLIDLGDPVRASARDNHYATATSNDGAVIVGYTYNAQPFRWTLAAGMMDLGVLPGGGNRYYQAWGVSGDGQVVVGYEQDPVSSNYRGFRWTQSTGMMEVPGLPGSANTFINMVSRDGRVLVGWSDAEAIYWTQASGTRAVPRPDTVSYWSAASASSDGSIIAGNYQMAGSRSGAFRWDGSANPQFLVPGGQANGMSADGSTVVGQGQQGAFLWDTANGSRAVTSVVPAIQGFNTLDGANATSADGRVIVGYGTDTANLTDSWVVNLGADGCTPP